MPRLSLPCASCYAAASSPAAAVEKAKLNHTKSVSILTEQAAVDLNGTARLTYMTSPAQQ